MPIQIIDGFSLNAARPIDSRLVTTGTASRDAMTYKYNGLRVYDVVQNVPFVYANGLWKQEGGSIISGGTLNLEGAKSGYVTRFSSTGLTNSVIRETTGVNKYIGINIPDNSSVEAQLHVGGTVKASTFVGNISGSNILDKTVGLSKLTTAGNQGTFVLKSVNNVLQWATETVTQVGGGGGVTVQNDTTSSSTFLTFGGSVNAPSLLTSCKTLNCAIMADLATSQLTLSNTNTHLNPAYSFISNKSTGFYGGSTEVGMSMAGNKRVYADGTKTYIGVGGSPILDASSSCINLCKNTQVTGDITGTGNLTISCNTSLSGCLTVATGKCSQLNGPLTVAASQATLLGGTLTVTGNSTLNGTLTVANSQATSLSGTLTVTGNSTLNGTLTVANSQATSLSGTLAVTGTTALNNDTTITGDLTVSTGNVVNLSGTTIKAISCNNELNFVNNDAFNSNPVYFNYRGAITNGINEYIFWNGRTCAAAGGAVAKIRTGGLESLGPVKIGANGTEVVTRIVGFVKILRSANGGGFSIADKSNNVAAVTDVSGSGSSYFGLGSYPGTAGWLKLRVSLNVVLPNANANENIINLSFGEGTDNNVLYYGRSFRGSLNSNSQLDIFLQMESFNNSNNLPYRFDFSIDHI